VEFGHLQKRIIYCHDPEGNLLELCDFQPSPSTRPDNASPG
jgi:hypothetical protein